MLGDNIEVDELLEEISTLRTKINGRQYEVREMETEIDRLNGNKNHVLHMLNSNKLELDKLLRDLNAKCNTCINLEEHGHLKNPEPIVPGEENRNIEML